MMEKSITGTNNCFVCGRKLNWEKIQDPIPWQVTALKKPEVTADACAIGINEDGTVKFEITCTCPKCKSKNKFCKDVKVE